LTYLKESYIIFNTPPTELQKLHRMLIIHWSSLFLDEEALVKGSVLMGHRFTTRTPTAVIVEVVSVFIVGLFCYILLVLCYCNC